MSCKVFIDGSSGTTGLRIAARLARRPELELLTISEAGRKDLACRAEVINAADLAFLCLPDAASKEVIPLVDARVKVLDTSTAFRTAPGWVYGFPELHGQREAIRAANRVAVPGCHASGFIALARPLVELGLVPADYPFSCHSLTGYSGGGKKMIAEYEDAARPALYSTPRAYGLTLHHKHLPEMQVVSGLSAPPVFCPIVDDYYSGMEVTVPLRMELLPGVTPAQIAGALAGYYAGEPPAACGRDAGRRGPAGLRPHRAVLHRQPRRQPDAADLPVRQPRQGFVGRGGPVHESDAGPGRNGRPRMSA